MTSPPPLRPIAEVAAELGVDPQHLIPHGNHKAKLSLDSLPRPPGGAGRLVLVSAVTPTRAGEGKTTTSVGLAMALRRLGARAVVCLREPSLGPVFGIKGGGTGGGRAQVVPSDEINFHFTGDLHAVTSAHNLLAALLDSALHHETIGGLQATGVTWGRVLDVNDRALRRVAVGVASRGQAEVLYDLEDDLIDKLRAVTRTLYGAEDVELTPEAEAQLARFAAAGFDRLPLCVAKTHLSLSDDPEAGGDPRGFRVTVRELRLSAGAGFIVALCHILTMPGLPADPAARHVRIGPDGRVRGLMQGE